MKSLKSFGILGLLGLGIIAFCLSIFLAQPSDATMAKYQKLVAMGIVDEIVTPQEIGLDYLQRESVQLAGDPGLINAIYEAEQGVSVMPEDIPLEFPGGTNSPIRIGRIPNDTGTPSEATDVSIEGFVDREGKAESFTPSRLEGMFNGERNNGGNITWNQESENILVADASGTFLQARRIPVIDLIARRGSRRLLVRRVNANAVCRDGLNAYFNGNLTRR